MQIAQTPRQYKGWLRLQIKDIYHIYNFVERLFFVNFMYENYPGITTLVRK